MITQIIYALVTILVIFIILQYTPIFKLQKLSKCDISAIHDTLLKKARQADNRLIFVHPAYNFVTRTIEILYVGKNNILRSNRIFRIPQYDVDKNLRNFVRFRYSSRHFPEMQSAETFVREHDQLENYVDLITHDITRPFDTFDPRFIKRHLRNVDIQTNRIVYTMANGRESVDFTIELPANVEARKTVDSLQIHLMSVTPCKTSRDKVTMNDYEQFYLESLLDDRKTQRLFSINEINNLRWICTDETDRKPRLALRR